MPQNFYWLIENEIAGMGKPYDLRKALEALKDLGIGAIVSLTESPLQEALINEFGFEYRHLPIPDFCAPDPDQIDEFVRFVNAMKRKKQAVVAHCLAGRGRTGTMLACYLVSKGHDAKEAIAEVRRVRAGAVETGIQEKAIEYYARRRKKKGRR